MNAQDQRLAREEVLSIAANRMNVGRDILEGAEVSFGYVKDMDEGRAVVHLEGRSPRLVALDVLKNYSNGWVSGSMLALVVYKTGNTVRGGFIKLEAPAVAGGAQ